jgi:prepilin-type N-terminal cleavage/methylation domain-containing protein
MKKAFTMIELIFVIVIIGVLGAVAIPRYFSVQNEAETSLVKSFAATLTRTVGHSLWSKSISEGDGGSLKVGNTDKFYGDSLEKFVDIPVYFDKTTVDFSKCVNAGSSAQPFLQKSSQGRYNVFCRDGDSSNAPKFVADQGASYQF